MLSSRRATSFASIFARKLGIAITALAITISTMPTPGVCAELNGQSSMPSTVGKFAKKPASEDVVIVRLNRGADRDEFNKTLEEVDGNFLHTIDVTPEIQLLVIQTEPGQAAQVVKKLKGKKDVASVERNYRYDIRSTMAPAASGDSAQSATLYKGNLVATSLTPNDPFFASQWDLAAMEYAQGRVSTGLSACLVPMYFLDTGMAYFPGESCPISGQFDFSDPVNPTGVFEQMHDSGFHGTAVSSVTASSDNGIGLAGCANFEFNHCMVYMLRISQDGESASVVSILSALAFILNNPLCTAGPINVSFGSPDGVPSLNSDPNIQLLGYYLYLKGCLVVLAAGNVPVFDDSPELFCRRVMATDQTGGIASFSTTGLFNSAAPGVNVPVYVPAGGDTVEYYASGTSFAAPRWCSAIAQVMASTTNKKHRTAPRADQIVTQTATLSTGGITTGGATGPTPPVPNLGAAIKQALQN